MLQTLTNTVEEQHMSWMLLSKEQKAIHVCEQNAMMLSLPIFMQHIQ